MILYRYQGNEEPRPVSDWISETDAYRNMAAASGRWFADTPEEAMWYECEHESGLLLALHVDDAEAEQWRVSKPADATAPKIRVPFR